MAIQVTAPERIAFSLNPIVWKFESDREGITLGVISQNLIVFIGPVPVNTLLTIRWNGNQQQLRAVQTPRAFGGEIPAGDGGTAYVASLLSWFQNNYYFNEDFNVAVTTKDDYPALLFQAKANGSAYDFSPTNFAGGYTAVDVPGVDNTEPINSSVMVEVWVRKGVALEYLRVYRSPLALDAYSATTLDVSAILHGELVPDSPSDIVPGGTFVHSSRLDYYIKYALAGGENFAIGQLTQSSVYSVLLGGTSYEAGSDATVARTLRPGNPSQDKFLSLLGSTRYVYVSQPAYLSFVNLREETRAQATLRIRVSYTDNTTTDILLTQITTLHSYQKAAWPVGYNQLNLASQKTVKQYTARLLDQNQNPISEEVLFVLLYDHKPYLRYFAYVNSLGATDTLYTYGKGSPNLNFFKDAAQQVLPYTYAREDGQYMEWDHETQEGFEVATGFLRVGDYLTYRDFFRSARKYRLVGGQAYPINISSNSIKEGKDASNIHALSFAYQYAFRNKSVSLADLEKEHFGATLGPPPGVAVAGSILLPAPGVPFTGVVDSYPTVSSPNLVTSGGINEALAQKQNKLPAGIAAQYLRGDGTLGLLETAVRASQEHRPASQATPGEIQLASQAEATAGTNTTKAITPALLKAALTVQFSRSFPVYEPTQQGQLVAIINNTARLAIANVAESLAVGIAGASVTTGSALKIQTQGSFVLGLNPVVHGYIDPEDPGAGIDMYYNELVPGHVYYLSAIVPGAITPTPPAVGIVLPVGYAISTTEFCFFRGQPYRAGSGLMVDNENILTLDLITTQRPVFNFPNIAETEAFSITYTLETYLSSYHAIENINVKAIIELPGWLTASYDNTAKTITLEGTPPANTTARVLVITEDSQMNNGIDTINIQYEEPTPQPTITTELWDFTVTPAVKLGDITEGVVLPWKAKYNIMFTVANHTHDQVKQILLGPGVEFEWGPDDVAGGATLTTSSHWVFGPTGDSDGKPPGNYVLYPHAWLGGSTSLSGYVTFSLNQEVSQEPVTITAELWDFSVTPTQKIGNIVGGTTLQWSPKFNIKFTVSGPHTQIEQSLIAGNRTDGWGPENSAGGAVTNLQSHWVFGPNGDSNGRLPGSYTFSPKAYKNGVLVEAATFQFAIQQPTQAAIIGELWNEATNTKIATMAEFNGSYALPSAWGVKLRTLGYAFNGVGITLSKSNSLVYSRTHSLTATTAETVVPLFPTGENSTDHFGLLAGDYVAVFTMTINGALVANRNYNFSLGAQPDATGMFTVQKGGKIFTFVDTPDVQLEILATGNVKLVITPTTKTSINSAKTCSPYILINERVPRADFRAALLSTSGAVFSSEKTYSIMVAWLPNDIITSYVDIADASKMEDCSLRDSNKYQNSAGYDYIYLTIQNDIDIS